MTGIRAMGLLKIFFRAAIKSKCRRPRRTSTIFASTQQVKKSYSPQPISDSEKVRHQNDIERIQALPKVKVEHVIDGDTVIVSSASSEIKIRLGLHRLSRERAGLGGLRQHAA